MVALLKPIIARHCPDQPVEDRYQSLSEQPCRGDSYPLKPSSHGGKDSTTGVSICRCPLTSAFTRDIVVTALWTIYRVHKLSGRGDCHCQDVEGQLLSESLC